ncbi:TRAF3-interacting protein 1 [Aegotheles albertisi]
MDAAVVRQTQDSLGRVIRKPPLTERLLSKPPFRYLHDLITEVIRVTGFMKGLYTDFELKSDNVKDKDAKISFLQKAIDTVVMVTGEPLAVKPARVVAGQEPEKTNEFLQAIGKCCLNKLSSDVAVKRVLSGERADSKGKPPPSKSRDKESGESKTEQQKKHKEGRGDTEIKDRSSSRDRKPKGDLKESEEREKESDKQKDNEDRHKDPGRDTYKEAEKQERERNKSRTTKQGRGTEKNKGEGDIVRGDDLEHDKGQEKETERTEREKKNEGGREKDRVKGRDKDKARYREREKDRERAKDRERDRQRDRETDGEHVRKHGKDKAEKKSVDSEETTQRPTKDSKSQPDDESESPAGLSRQPSTKGSRQHAKPGGEGNKREDIMSIKFKYSADKIQNTVVRKVRFALPAKPKLCLFQLIGEAENTALKKPSVSEDGEVPNDLPPQPIQRRIPRPSSARPAPLRVKRQESAEVLLPERSGSGKTVSNVIIDQQVSDDDDEFVVEAAELLLEVPEIKKEPEVELVEDEKHGGLVKRILETKKDYEESQKSSKMTEREKPFVSEADRKKERDLVANEIEKTQVSMQTLCQHVLSLVRILDYIQEDVDAMKNELQMWQHENREHAEALQKEQSITDSTIKPLKAELAELEQLIKDQQDKNRAVKANILKNEEKIRWMILNRNVSSRR